MKIKYKFLDGTVTEVEVSEEIGNIILESRRREHADNERHRYHTGFSLNGMTYEGDICGSVTGEPVKVLAERESADKCEAMLSRLTSVQRRRFERLMDGNSVAEIARAENASFNSVKESIEAARKKLEKLL